MKIIAKIIWKRKPDEAFIDGAYQRVHQWQFDGGMTLDASASPEIVAIPMSDPALIDPEEAFLASIASCHMLFFLSIAAKRKVVVESYTDHPEAVMGQVAAGKLVVLSILLQPKLVFGGAEPPSEASIQLLREMAHANCFLANSIKTEVIIKRT